MPKEAVLNVKMRPSIIKILKNEGYQLVDMHFHTTYSDGTSSVQNALRKAYRLGIGLAITDHNEIRAAQIACKQQSVMVIPGMEITCKEGMHALVYFHTIDDGVKFFEKNVKPFHGKHKSSFTTIPFSQLIVEARKSNCLLVAAHPYGIGLTGMMRKKHEGIVTPDLIKQFDALEGLCGSSIRSWNTRSQRLAQLMGRPMTGGSDGHTLREMAHVLTYAKAFTTSDFLNAIKHGNATVIGRETNLMYNVGAQAVKIKNVPSVGVYVKRNIQGIMQKLNGSNQEPLED